MSGSIWNPGSTITPTPPFSTPVGFIPGSVTIPGIYFNGFSGSGFWSESGGSVDTTVNGVAVLKAETAGLTLQTGKKLSTAVEVDIASSATCDIGGAASNSVRITGTSNITSFGATYRGPMFVRFAGALTLTNSASLILPGGINITTVAGDTCIVTPKATAGVSDGWVISSYVSAALFISAKSFGAVGDGVTNDTAAVQLAITAGAGGWVYFPEGTYLCANLSIPVDTTLFGPGILKKNANGPVLTLDRRSVLLGIAIDGNGTIYTGQGVLISTGSLDNTSWRRLSGVNIYNTASYCLEFSGAISGYSSQTSDCRFLPTQTSPGVYDTYAVKLPSNGGVTESGGNRMFSNCWSFAARFVDLADSENTNLTGCHGFWPLFTTGTAKCSIAGGRLNLYDAAAILTGTANTVSGLTINYNVGAALTISSGAVNCRFDSSNAIGSGATITDNSNGNTSGNEIYIPRKVYTPTWGGTAGTPAIGNGTLSASYIRRGSMVAVTVQLIIGGTTNFNLATAWTFSLPYAASRAESGSAYILDTGTTHIVGVSRVVGGDSFAKVYTTAAGGGIGYLIPMTWAVGDELVFNIEYEIQ